MVAAATSEVPAPSPGVLAPPRGWEVGKHHPNDYVQPTNKYHLPWDGGARVSACVCAWMYIYIFIYL